MESAWRQTACILCSINCGVEVRLGEGADARRFVRVRGDKAHPGSQGYTCEKGLRLDHYQSDPGRLTTPLRRRPDGSFEAIDWDTAIAEVAARFQEVIAEHGGDKVLFVVGMERAIARVGEGGPEEGEQRDGGERDGEGFVHPPD